MNERFAPAKINLGLHVLRQRPDGFHDIETVFVPIGWGDRVAVRSQGAFVFTCSDKSLPTDERNLCVRAAHALAEWAGIAPRGALHLEKRVPCGAGLGGGSSNAAHTLRLLAEAWDLSTSANEMHRLAAALGSDVPFFLHDRAMLGTGRGDILTTLDYEFPYALVVVMPHTPIASAEAYGFIRPQATGRADLRGVVESNDLNRWQAELVNDFEEPILARHPEIAAAKRLLDKAGAGYTALSGSGAAVFGAFEEPVLAWQALTRARSAGLRAWSSVS